MKKAIILHGKPGKEEYYNPNVASGSNYHWIPWLQKHLIVNDIKADTPEVPYSYDPRWELWVSEVERFEISPETTLVGHSCGGGFWIRYLSDRPKLKVGKVILVAPSLGKSWGDGGDKFFNGFQIDPKLAARTKGLVIFHSDNDKQGIQEAFSEIKAKITNIKVREFHNYGHFTLDDMKTSEFPELLEECLVKN